MDKPNVQYIWHTTGEDTCFSCKRWNGDLFSNHTQIPELPVHPNCQCEAEVVLNGQPILLQLKPIVLQMDKLEDELEQDKRAFNSRKNISFLPKEITQEFENVKEVVEDTYETVRIFWRNFNDLQDGNIRFSDKYFHAKANAEAAQLGKVGENVAKLISDSREVTQFYYNILINRMTVLETIDDLLADNIANKAGRLDGMENPDADIRDLERVQKYRPPTLPDEL